MNRLEVALFGSVAGPTLKISLAALLISESGCRRTLADKPDPQRGFAILAATRDSMPDYVGNNLRCFSCHLDDGRRQNAIPLASTYTHYPRPNPRDGGTMSIYDRVNNCFTRSLAGRAVPRHSQEMADIVAYLALIARGLPQHSTLRGDGLVALPRLTGDTTRGGAIFLARCARCHGTNGQGIPPATPLWGKRSYSIGASLARVSRAAAFIRYNMPFDSAGVLDDQQAYDVAAYVVSHPRPDTRGKQNDWPNGDAPWDVPYTTHGHVAYNPPLVLTPAFR